MPGKSHRIIMSIWEIWVTGLEMCEVVRAVVGLWMENLLLEIK